MALATPFLSLVGCSDDSADLTTLGGETMGTTYSVKLVAPPAGLDMAALSGEIDGLLHDVDRRMSTYRPDSELSRLNDAAAGTWTAISTDTRRVIDEALRVGELSGGAFDPTVGPLVDVWGFGAAPGEPRVPTSQAVAAARATTGITGVATRASPPAATKQIAGSRLDLSGVAKGFGVDLVAEHLDDRGLDNYLVEVGGELRAKGQGLDNRMWRVGIERPAVGSGELQHVLKLENAALATSGNYRIFFEQDGHRYSHIVDPRTGRPVTHNLASASVVAPTTMEADALSTALLVLGVDAGMRLAARHDIPAYFVTGHDGAFDGLASPAFERRIRA